MFGAFGVSFEFVHQPQIVTGVGVGRRNVVSLFAGFRHIQPIVPVFVSALVGGVVSVHAHFAHLFANGLAVEGLVGIKVRPPVIDDFGNEVGFEREGDIFIYVMHLDVFVGPQIVEQYVVSMQIVMGKGAHRLGTTTGAIHNNSNCCLGIVSENEISWNPRH